jgi:hypothetical protein
MPPPPLDAIEEVLRLGDALHGPTFARNVAAALLSELDELPRGQLAPGQVSRFSVLVSLLFTHGAREVRELAAEWCAESRSWLAPGAVMGNGFIGGSVFLAFAYLNPNFTFYIFFILPVRVKWLALITWVFYAYTVAFGGPVPRLAVLASTGNFLIFFGARIVADLRSGKRHMEGQRRRVAERREAEAAGPRHRCVTCAKNSDTHPDEDFRYTADDRCFCSEHLPRRTPGP